MQVLRVQAVEVRGLGLRGLYGGLVFSGSRCRVGPRVL